MNCGYPEYGYNNLYDGMNFENYRCGNYHIGSNCGLRCGCNYNPLLNNFMQNNCNFSTNMCCNNTFGCNSSCGCGSVCNYLPLLALMCCMRRW